MVKTIITNGFTNATSTRVKIVNSIGVEVLNISMSDDGSECDIIKSGVVLNDGIEVTELIRSEKYRMETALKYSTTNKQAFELLGMPGTTFYRKIKGYNLKKHNS